MKDMPYVIRKLYLDGQDWILSKKIFGLLGNIDGKVVGDVGCGYGLFSTRLAKRAKLVYAGEIRKEVVEKNKRYETPNLKFLQLDAQKLPFKDNFFDILVYRDVLEHIKNDKKTIDEARRVLKKGGIAIFSVPNKKFPQSHNFIITRAIRNSPLKKHHILANGREDSNESFFENCNIKLGHLHSYDTEFFKNISGFKLIKFINLYNGFAKYFLELTAFEASYNPKKRMFIFFRGIYFLFSFFPVLLDDLLGFADKDMQGFHIIVKLKKQ
jgi:2-polyprenyl-3-methyl-5-hydroxy-6-metoxy-1,4-benzoquinol methylase